MNLFGDSSFLKYRNMNSIIANSIILPMNFDPQIMSAFQRLGQIRNMAEAKIIQASQMIDELPL